MLPPLTFRPYLRPRIWGGRRLGSMLGKPLPDEQPYGESWELSSLPEHDSVVADGPLACKRLSEIWKQHRRALLGPQERSWGRTSFPLLIKWLDCGDRVSVQVHPDDDNAYRLLGAPSGKAEAWIVAACEADSTVGVGLRPLTGPDEVRRRLQEGTLAECLHTFHPRVGEVINVPAGMVHTLGRGLLLLEVEQPSDVTFRLDDWRRPGPDGRPRPLHHEQGLAAIDWTLGPGGPAQGSIQELSVGGVRWERLLTTPHFLIDRFQASGEFPSPLGGRLSVWSVTSGGFELTTGRAVRKLRMGDTVLVPAEAPDVIWRPADAEPSTLICVTLP